MSTKDKKIKEHKKDKEEKKEKKDKENKENKEITVKVMRFKGGKKIIQTDKADNLTEDQLFKVYRISDQLQKADEFYRKGNIDRAFTFYKFAAKAGDRQAQSRVTEILSDHPSISFQYHKDLADQGDLKSIRMTINSYIQGKGINSNLKKAREYLEKAAELEDPESLMQLGQYCLSGMGGQKDHKKALKSFRTAFEKLKYEPARYYLGLCYVLYGSHAEQRVGFGLLNDRLKQNDKDAKIRIGWCYMVGRGVDKDVLKAIQVLESCLKADPENHQVHLFLALALMFAPQGFRDRPRAFHLLTTVDALFQKSPPLAIGEVYQMLARCYRFGYGVLKNESKFIENLRRAAELGDISSRTMLAVCQMHNIGIPKNIDQAVKTLKELIKEKRSEAMTVLGVVKFMGWGKEKQNYFSAFNLFKQAINADPLQNESDALNNLGWCYLHGLGVAQNYTLAIKNFEEARAKRNRVAINNLAWCYLNGLGVPKDYLKAQALFLENQRWEHEECLANTFGMSYLKYWTLPSEITRLASEQPEIQYHLALCYLNGYGVEQDEKKALEILHQLATKKSYPEAMLKLGTCYIEGLGTEKSQDKDLKAFSLFSDAVINTQSSALGTEEKMKPSETNQPETKQNLESKAENEQRALRIASLKNHAYVKLALCRIHGRGITKNYEQGLELLRLCAAMGNPEAHYHLGLLFHNTDLESAKEHFKLAAGQGHEVAQQILVKFAAPPKLSLQVTQPFKDYDLGEKEKEEEDLKKLTDTLNIHDATQTLDRTQPFLPMLGLHTGSQLGKSNPGLKTAKLKRLLKVNARTLHNIELGSEFYQKNNTQFLS